MVDGIKVANYLILKWGDYPGLPAWTQLTAGEGHRGGVRELGRRDQGRMTRELQCGQL